MQIQISWLLQKPTDLDLHCLQRQGISRFSRTRVKRNGNKVIGNTYKKSSRLRRKGSLEHVPTLRTQIRLCCPHTECIAPEKAPFFQPSRKHAYSNILRILPPKNENFQMKNSGSFHISARNIDCGYLLELPWWGGSNEYPQSMFLSRNKKNNVYTPVNPSFTV